MAKGDGGAKFGLSISGSTVRADPAPKPAKGPNSSRARRGANLAGGGVSRNSASKPRGSGKSLVTGRKVLGESKEALRAKGDGDVTRSTKGKEDTDMLQGSQRSNIVLLSCVPAGGALFILIHMFVDVDFSRFVE